MKLVIAEKPSVAQSLARVIGATKRQDGYLEGNGYLVSWCVGHLVELSAPERYDERFAKWRLEDLPILPERFLYEVSTGTSKQYQILKGLMERPDVESLVCATDAGREGELIFRLVYNQCRCKKIFERLWISSMDPVRSASVFDSSKVSDHHAIIPTKTMVGSDLAGLSSGEKAVLQLISARLLCAVAEDHRYTEMTVILSSGSEEFTKKGKTVLVPGWKAIWQHFYPEKKDEDASGPVPAEDTLVKVDAAEVKEG